MKNRLLKHILLLVFLWGIFCASLFSYTTPMKMTLQVTLASKQDGPLSGPYDVNVSIVNKKNIMWEQYYKRVTFTQGTCSIVLGLDARRPLYPDYFNFEDTLLQLNVSGRTVKLPLLAIPYAIQARKAEEVVRVDASTISGTFVSTVNISADLVVSSNLLVVKTDQNKIGVGTPSPQYTLDVAGIVNADDYTIQGKNIESFLTWERKDQALLYDKGYVGIGTRTPNVELDVSGVVNAKLYKIKGKNLTSELLKDQLWKPGGGKDIYYDDGVLANGGFVGIGTANPKEKLDVRGAIRISESLSEKPEAGTIQYKDSDFLGYTGKEWRSLIGISGSGVPGQIAYWVSNKALGGDNQLFWDTENQFLGIGTSNPTARVEIIATSNRTPFHVKGPEGETLFYVGKENVGIGTSTPNEKLRVNGIVDASGYTINGEKLENTLAANSLWLLERTIGKGDSIFYDGGNVGIGTREPNNLLEIASVSENPSITFDIGGEDLFTLGIDQKYKDSFVIAEGGNLDVPVFTFKGERIGIGLKEPKANLHVSGNAGVIFSGTYGNTGTLSESGTGAKLIWYPGKAAFRAGRIIGSGWNEENLGLFSVAMGDNNIVTGSYSTVIGGYENSIGGQYSVIPGGLRNRIYGDYGFAAGHRAYIGSGHNHSFVWNDYTPEDGSYFKTAASNQFLIRAYNGVGIGTSNTSEAVLSLYNHNLSRQGHLLFQAKGPAENDVFVITPSGNVGIGTDNPKNAKLVVMNGDVAIGTKNALATLTVENTAPDNIVLMVLGEQGPETPAFFVNSQGKIGIGIPVDYEFGPSESIKAAGSIQSESFVINTPSGNIELEPNPGSPWSNPANSDNKRDTNRTKGRIGIGTATPNSLLELSNQNELKSPPVITFDLDGIDYYSMGVSTVNEDVSFFTIQPGGGLTSTPPIVIATSSVGIGIGLAIPSASLHVSGDMILNGKVAIATTNFSTMYDMYVDGQFNVDELYIGGEKFVPSETPWKTFGTDIYFTTGNVGIGTKTPSTRLEVVGTVSANGLTLTNEFDFDGDLFTKRLVLEDTTSANQWGYLFISGNDLNYTSPSGDTKTIGSSLQYYSGDDTPPGNFSYFVNGSTTTLGETTMLWEGPGEGLTISGNLSVTLSHSENGLRVTSNVHLGAPSGMVIQSSISNSERSADTLGYTAEDISIDINSVWGRDDERVYVKGMDVKLQTSDPVINLFDSATAIGLMVDVSSVNVEEGGKKYAAIFNGGNVGIGVEDPEVALHVAGTVSANYFNLSGGIDVSQLIVGEKTMVVTSVNVGTVLIPRVGIGIENPELYDEELQVAGTISSNRVILSGGLETATLNINNGALYVDADGQIGIGTTVPTSQIDIHVTIDSTVEADYTTEKINITLDGAAPNSVWNFPHDLKGLDVQLQANSANELKADATGIKVDLSNLNIQDSSVAKGLDVDVTGTTGTRYAAIFQGGRVGIGTDAPSVDLHVVGNVKADNLELIGTLKAAEATFNYLTVSKGATFNGTVSVNNLIAADVTVNRLIVSEAYSAPEATFSSLNATNLVVGRVITASTANISSSLNAAQGLFSGGVGVGTTSPPSSGLEVNGSLSANSLSLSGGLSVAADVTINNYLYVTDASGDNRVGIGMASPEAGLHVSANIADVFDVADNDTWSMVHIQNPTTLTTRAAGILLMPDSTTSTSSIGSGIAAIRSSSHATNIGSHMVFITDPDTGPHQERMRITNAGNVGIGTISPDYALDVSGNTRVGTNLIVDETLYTSKIESSSTITINPTEELDVDGTLKVSNDLELYGALYLNGLAAAPAADSAYGQLFMDDTNGNLYYTKPGGTAYNISASFTGGVNRVPYFNASGINSDAPIYWNDTTKVFTVGDSDSRATFEISTTVDATVAPSIYAQKIHMNFDERSSATTSLFKGLDIKMQSNNPLSSDFGRLAQNETAIGLHVDLTDLDARYYTGEGTSDTTTDGIKYAALFEGGNVGIGIEPSAALHVKSPLATQSLLQMDSNTVSDIMKIDAEGRVGFGGIDTGSSMTIKAHSSLNPLTILDSAGDEQVYISSTGRLGINTASNASAMLSVTSDASTMGLRIDGSSTTHDLAVKNGEVSIGATPQTNVTLYVKGATGDSPFKVVSDGTSAIFVDSDGEVGIGTETPLAPLHVNGVIYSGTGAGASLPDLSAYTNGYLVYQGNDNYAFLGHDGTNPILDFSDDFIFQADSVQKMRLTSEGVLIGTGTSVSVPFEVNGSANFKSGTTSTLFVDASSNKVGIKDETPSAELDVNGAVQASTLAIDGIATAKQLTVTSSIVINRDVNSSDGSAVSAQQIDIDLNGTNEGGAYIYGLDVDIDSGTFDSGTYSLYGPGVAYGLKVDVSGLTIAGAAKKYAGVFHGGNVGIGTSAPAAGLHVVSDTNQDIARFGTSTGYMDVHENEAGEIAFNISDGTAEYPALVLKTDSTTGYVGIGATGEELDKKLVVDGDVRLGIVEDGGTLGSAGYGDKLFFSGAADIASGYDSDNDCPLWMARYNASTNATVAANRFYSELRVNIGDKASTNNKFVIGYTDSTDAYKPVLSVNASQNVGISDGTVFTPEAILHVKGNKDGAAYDPANNIMTIENTDPNGNGDCLLIEMPVAGTFSNYNFITFAKSGPDGELGKIQANDADSVKFMTKASDYAEYLPKSNKNEVIEKGDIVGIYNGKVSKSYQDAQLYLVKSTAPGVAGNYPGEKKLDLYEIIAFFGQVPVKVRGQVKAGDYIVPYDRYDGTGIAVAPDQLTVAQKQKIVGRAWESSSDKNIKLINTAVGFNFSLPDFKEELVQLKGLQEKLEQLKSDRETMQTKFESQLQSNEAMLKELQIAVKKLAKK